MQRTPVDLARSLGAALLAVLLAVAAGAFGAPAQARAASHSPQARTAGQLVVRAGHLPRLAAVAQPAVRHAEPDTGPAPVVSPAASVLPAPTLGAAVPQPPQSRTGFGRAGERHTRAPPG
jgi:hypothetical protein